MARPLGQHREGCHDTVNAGSGSGHRRDSEQDAQLVERANLAAHVPGRPGAVGGDGGGDLRHRQRQPGPDTIILLGSFLVPVAFVSYAFAHADEVVTAQRIFTAFVYGGVLGVLGASVLGAAFLRRPSEPAFFGVGLIEEAVKLAALWLLARRLPRYTMRDGIVLGAAVGFGFAAFESAGYAFNALFTSNGLSLLNLVETEVLRGILTRSGTARGRPSSAGRCSRPRPAEAGCGSVVPSSGGMWSCRCCTDCGTPPGASRCGSRWCSPAPRCSGG